MSDIQRYDFDSEEYHKYDDGEFMKYCDHETKVLKLESRIKKLEKARRIDNTVIRNLNEHIDKLREGEDE